MIENVITFFTNYVTSDTTIDIFAILQYYLSLTVVDTLNHYVY